MPAERVDVRALDSRSAVVDHARELLRSATDEVVLVWPAERLSVLEDELRAARERDALVLLVATGTGAADIASEYPDLATVARAWGKLDHRACGTFSLLCVDGHRGMIVPSRLLFDLPGRTRTLAFDDEYLEHMAFGWFLSGFWVRGVERYANGPTELPRTYEGFRHAVIAAAVALRERRPLSATVEARPTDDDEATFGPLTGQVVTVRQRFVAPATNSFPGEQTLVLRTDEGKVTVGGHGAFLEDYESRSVTLQEGP